MSLLDDNRAARERQGLVGAEWLARDRGLYGGGCWSFEPLRHPEAIKAAREAKAATEAQHRADLDEADRLAAIMQAGGTIPNEYETERREAAE